MQGIHIFNFLPLTICSPIDLNVRVLAHTLNFKLHGTLLSNLVNLHNLNQKCDNYCCRVPSHRDTKKKKPKLRTTKLAKEKLCVNFPTRRSTLEEG